MLVLGLAAGMVRCTSGFKGTQEHLRHRHATAWQSSVMVLRAGMRGQAKCSREWGLGPCTRTWNMAQCDPHSWMQEGQVCAGDPCPARFTHLSLQSSKS